MIAEMRFTDNMSLGEMLAVMSQNEAARLANKAAQASYDEFGGDVDTLARQLDGSIYERVG